MEKEIKTVKDLHEFGIEVFNNDVVKYDRWLRHPNRTMGGVTPYSLLETPEGVDEMYNSLYRMEHNVYV